MKETELETTDKRETSFWCDGKMDYPVLMMVALILIFGLAMVYSTSSYKGNEVFGDSWYFLKRQVVFSGIAFAFMLLISRINYNKLELYSKLCVFIAIAFLLLVYIIGTASHGSTRWIYIGAFGFQPSEFAKLALIIYTASVCTAYPKRLNTFKGMAKLLFWPVITIVLIAIENLSTAIICFVIVVIIMFVASPKIWHFLLLGIIGAIGSGLFILFAGYRADRIRIWLNPEKYDDGYQTMQSLYAIGSGGLFGRGYGKSIQKMGFIPESHNDMIFSVICEELGILGAIFVVTIFIALLYRCAVIAINSGNRFGGLMVCGVMGHIAIQVIINICVVTNTIPPTGVTLPFISYGGSSVFFVLLEMGIVLAVSRQIKPGR